MKSRALVVVEDEPDFARLLAHHFRALGFRVRTAGTGAAGLAAVKRSNPDLAIVDLDLPDYDGLKLCRRLRRGGRVRILILTAKKECFASVRDGYEADGYAYMEKPVSLSKLTEEVERLLSR